MFEAKMSKRVLDKKIVKISFNESSDEQDYNCSWDGNFSSDEDVFFKGKSEILWSRNGDLFEYPDSSQSFSDLTGRTFSSCSWHNDEFDMKTTSKVSAALEAIDEALYDKVKSPLLNDNVFQECCDWAEKFPYFRIKGEQIVKSSDDPFISCSMSSLGLKRFGSGSSTTSLQLEGRKLPIHAGNKSKGVYFDCSINSKVPDCFEETIDREEFEEYLALHERMPFAPVRQCEWHPVKLNCARFGDGPGDNLKVPMIESSKSPSSVKLMQDKALDKLVSDMWPSVLAFLQKFDDKNNIYNDDLQLPPITVMTEQKRALCLQRPKTEGCDIMSTEFPKLESILTVSPKILQKRKLGNGCVCNIARPSSEMSVNLHMSSKTTKPEYHQTSSNALQMKYESLHARGSKSMKESENLCLVLPSLQEGFQDTSSILRGFHIEPGRKETLHKTTLSSRNDYETVSTSRESEYFLPPIEDKSYIPTNAKLTKNLFTFYGSSVISDKNKVIGSAKYRKANSRPNTSLSKKVIKSDEVTQRNGLYVTTKNISKISCSGSERNSKMSLGDNEDVDEENQEKLVTLFPIVTSLTPHEDKNNFNKRGLLHNFLRGRKR